MSDAPPPEVLPTTKRHAFSNAEKLRILSAANACAVSGDIGALLHYDGIDSSHLAAWRKQHQSTGEAAALEFKRSPKADPISIQTLRTLKLEKEVERLRAKLVKAD